MNRPDVWIFPYKAGAGLVVVSAAVLWFAVRALRDTGRDNLRRAGRVVDHVIAEEHAPVRRFAVGVAAVPDRQEGGQG